MAETQSAMETTGRVVAPWTRAQVVGLNRWQRAGYVHEFTCSDGHPLVATTEGWICDEPGCLYTQDWAHDFMAAGPGPHPQVEIFGVEEKEDEDESCPFCLDSGLNRPADSGEFWDCPECDLPYGDCNAEGDHG